MMSSRTFMVDVICTSVVDARLSSPRCISISIDDLCSHACVRGILTHQTLSGTSNRFEALQAFVTVRPADLHLHGRLVQPRLSRGQ